MLNLVIDTNVLVAGLRSKRGASYRLIRLLPEGRYRLNLSVALALEYEDVLNRPDLATGATKHEISVFLDYLMSACNLEPSVPRLRPSLPDPNDDRILELAVQCRATIVTYNRRDFEGSGKWGISVVTPSEFLVALREAI